MNAMEFSRRYYHEYCAPMLDENFAMLSERIAVGLVGEGSECFGFDDEISRDHDWGAAVCLWLVEDDFRAYGQELQSALDALALETGAALPLRRESPMAAGRSGVIDVFQFYFRHTGFRYGPQTLLDWMRIPEERLATVTNGEVFSDPFGLFSAIRKALLAFYPEDVRRKKLASRLALIAQTGQYNLGRCRKRGERVATKLAESLFITNVISVVFLLNRRYMPFYKWAHRSLSRLPVLGAEVADQLDALLDDEHSRKEERIEDICRLIAGELRTQRLSSSTDDFLLEQAIAVQRSIRDKTLRGMSVFTGDV